MVSKTGGLVGMLFSAGQILYAVHTLPAEIPLKTIQDAVDPTCLKQYMATHKGQTAAKK
jgi:hypothetical protein